MTTTYLDPTQESGARFFSRGLEGPVVMLNLLRFRPIDDYSAAPELAPADPITGRAAYDLYMAHTAPFLKQSGGEIVFIGDSSDFLIGPPDETWDLAMLVRHKDPQVFLAFASDPAYLAGIGHRTAALADSRLLPLVEWPESTG
jgi:uncharacterized protein (DUF1330 family)